jgi:hypothetical protein
MDYPSAAISSVLFSDGDGKVTAAKGASAAVTFTVYFRNFVN